VRELDRKVLDEIERRKLAPRPPLYFLAKRSVFWTFAALSVVLGAVSIAVIIYRVSDQLVTGGRGFDEMPFDDIAELLPGVWAASFVLFMASAVLAISHTKRGYRHRRLNVVGVAAAASILLGLFLYVLDVGPIAHSFLASRFPAYRDFTYIPYDEWQRPDQGFLGGEVLAEDTGQSLRIRDFDGREWDIDISTAEIAVADPLIEEGDIAIRGERTGPSTFKAEFIDAFD
jgi:hypothetical protein